MTPASPQASKPKTGWRDRAGALLSYGNGRPLGLIAALAFAALIWAQPALVRRIQDVGFDALQNLFPRAAAIGSVVIVQVDDASIAKEGQWPWSRAVMADLVEKIAAARPAAIYSDILWSEPDRLSPANLVAEEGDSLTPAARAALSGLPDNDSLLAAAIHSSKIALGSAGLFTPSPPGPPLPWPIVMASGGDPGPRVVTYQGALRNLPPIEFAAHGHGLMSNPPSDDGVTRRVTMIARVGHQLVPGVALETLRLAANAPMIQTITGPNGLYEVHVGPLVIPVQPDGSAWLHFGPDDPARFVSAADVIDGKVGTEVLQDAVVMIGVTGIGLLDKPMTPLGTMPGVEVLAQFIESALTKDWLTRPDWAAEAEAGAALAGGLLMVLLLPMLALRWQAVLAAAMLLPVPAAAAFAFREKGTLLDGATPTLAILLISILMTYANYANEEKKRRQVRAAFGRYLSPAMVDRVAHDQSALDLGGETRDMTLLFCDVRGFTTISEMFDAHGLTRLINRFLSPMTELILARRGTIDKYMGDCIMAFWNAPLDDPDHARNACRSALAMNERLGALNAELAAESKAENRRHVSIRIGIGLNSGPAVVGNMGCELRMDYSCLGDTVNTASRLEGQSKEYGVTIVIGRSTRDGAPDFAALELDDIQVKGKTEGVRIYTLLGGPELAAEPEFQEMVRRQDAMLAAYRGQRWQECREWIAKCRAQGRSWELDPLYDLFERRVDDYEKDPPGEGWNGVYVAKTK